MDWTQKYNKICIRNRSQPLQTPSASLEHFIWPAATLSGMLLSHGKCISSVREAATLRRCSWDALEDDLSGPAPATPLGHGVVPDPLEVFVANGAALALAEEPRDFQPLAAFVLGHYTVSMLSNPNSRNLLP